MDDVYFMSQAILEAERAFREGEVPVGAVLVREGEIISKGFNVKTIDPTAHAEMRVIREAAARLGGWNLRGCDLYVTLEPCPMCAGAAVAARLRSVVFGARDPRAGAVGSLYDIPRDTRLNHRCRVRGGVLKESCAELLIRYFEKRRKKLKTENGAAHEVKA
ncbi:MAG: tRNA adenosine(34) deaminase TadA [Synergistaceae bacterium]|jgi:tRNA(adenine34) deaminase|nr:tRNA adenosine(34) deaminase TadA [Synergistaceae bacterium]